MNDNLIDTNILVYAYDLSEEAKREKCKKIIRAIFSGEKTAFVTNQVLAEFFVVVTRKIEKPMKEEDAKIVVNGIIDSDNWKKLVYSHNTLKRAINTAIFFKTNFWDALIAETMLENSVFEIITENTKDFEKIPKLFSKNPFK